MYVIKYFIFFSTGKPVTLHIGLSLTAISSINEGGGVGKIYVTYKYILNRCKEKGLRIEASHVEYQLSVMLYLL